MDKFNQKYNELKILINEYKKIVDTLQNKVVGKGKEYTQNELEEWLAADKKLDDLKTQLQQTKTVARDIKNLLNNNKNGGKRKTRRNRKSKKSKTRKRKGKK